MNDRIILVSEPDDITVLGIRILLYDLNKTQQDIVSRSLISIESNKNLIVYSSTNKTDVKYLFDKYYKSQLIIFNAESENQTIVGFLASQSNSMYFGNLRDLAIVNDSIIHDVDDCRINLERLIIKYGKI